MADTPTRPKLRDAIIRHLREAGSDSISGVARALSNMDRAPVHRLSIAGHLAAMTEEGVLREVERPPSKHYQVTDGNQFLSLHERVGAAIGELNLPSPDRAAATVAVLGQLLGRPIFQTELTAAGFSNPGRGVDTIEASEELRRALRHVFRADGPHPMDIPRGDPLLECRAGAISGASIQDGIRRIALNALDGHAMSLPPGGLLGGIQARLDFGGPQ